MNGRCKFSILMISVRGAECHRNRGVIKGMLAQSLAYRHGRFSLSTLAECLACGKSDIINITETLTFFDDAVYRSGHLCRQRWPLR